MKCTAKAHNSLAKKQKPAIIVMQSPFQSLYLYNVLKDRWPLGLLQNVIPLSSKTLLVIGSEGDSGFWICLHHQTQHLRSRVVAHHIEIKLGSNNLSKVCEPYQAISNENSMCPKAYMVLLSGINNASIYYPTRDTNSNRDILPGIYLKF